MRLSFVFQGFKGFREEKNPCFLRGFPGFFFQQSKGWRVRVVPRVPVSGSGSVPAPPWIGSPLASAVVADLVLELGLQEVLTFGLVGLVDCRDEHDLLLYRVLVLHPVPCASSRQTLLLLSGPPSW